MTMELVKSGVDGLDDMLGGGIPRGHAVAVVGSFGTGKTTFGLQFINRGLESGDRGIFITLEEDVDSVIEDAISFGWDLQPHLDDETLSVVKLEPADAKSTVTRIRSELPSFIKKFGAQRLVVDSVSLLGMMFPDPVERRSHLFDLCQQVGETGATAVYTAESGEGRGSSDGLVEYISDGVILLRMEENPNTREVQPTLQIAKMRRLQHSRRVKPYSITENGLVVHTEAEVF
jgi:KaiC domain protein